MVPCNNVCMWFVTHGDDIRLRFRDDISCLYGRCELSFMSFHRLLALVPNTVVSN
jgi:hypothetical protein